MYNITTVRYDQPVTFRRGDANCDGKNDIADTWLIWDIANGLGSTCRDAADSNDDGVIDIDDFYHSLWHTIAGGPTPPAPFSTPGQDPTPDCLDCRVQCSP